ncbi:hypothetical protein [Longimicrobium terrae]|uniref:PKD domain-containing protein n=1 Tax=Longimicrobium terrae TaxID=1639882 RepID=A0A841GYL1_9BACT|nr:hypothetical protein [Longimicrobium terrae]MBB4636677.1 hypothetical protein [Longimicrobium terrae]MBB6070799.1 hypothetical protein [Longimicrobium terrae]NNC28825.1 hypothetical protein [Longimicrobium terrae]
MKKQAVALFALLLAACSDVTQPSPATEPDAARPEAVSDADAAAILEVATADPLFLELRNAGVLSAGRTANSATVLYTDGVRSVRRQFRRTGTTWAPSGAAISQLVAAGDLPSNATGYSGLIGVVYRLDSDNTTQIQWDYVHAPITAESGTWVSGSDFDNNQRLVKGVFVTGTETVHDTIYTVDQLEKITFTHRPSGGGSDYPGLCWSSPCTTIQSVGGVSYMSRQVLFHFHLKVVAPVVISAISGPDSVKLTGTYTWSAVGAGGDVESPAVAYEWQTSTDNVNWTAAGTTASKSITYSAGNHSSFYLRVRASRSGRTSPWSVKYVGVRSPLYPVLEVAPDGETVITTENPYTYTAGATGGTGTYTYQWYVIWDGSPYHPSGTDALGTGATQTLSVVPGDGSFTLRVHVTSNGQTFIGYKYVTNLLTCGEDYCPVEGD